MKNWLDNVRYEHLVAGVSGGVASTLILHPFDLIKIRFQGMDNFVATYIKQKGTHTLLPLHPLVQ